MSAPVQTKIHAQDIETARKIVLENLAGFNIRAALEESHIVRRVDVADLSAVDETRVQRVPKEGILWED